jgi:hypothetical protein
MPGYQMMSLGDLLLLKGESIGMPKLTNRILTPLRVTHSLVMEVWFSVQGEDEWGNACEEYKTRVRTLTLRKAVMIPSVCSRPDHSLTPVCSDSRIRRPANM